MRRSTFPCACQSNAPSVVVGEAFNVALAADAAVAPVVTPLGAGAGRASPSSNPAKNWRHAGSTDSGSRLH